MPLKEKYRNQVIYVTPGAGKTTLTNKEVVFYDADELIKEVMQELHPDFKMTADQTVQEYILAFTEKYKYKSKINNLALNKARKLCIDGFTVLTGTLKLAKSADYVFVMKPENQRIISRFKNISESTKFYEFQINYFKENKIPYHILGLNIEDELFVKRNI